MMDSSAVGLPMMLFSVLGVLAAVPVVIYAFVRKRWGPIKKVGMAAALWVGIYAILLLLASFTSTDRVIHKGERLAFCGFYLDCHIGVRIDSASVATEIHTTAGTFTPARSFNIVYVTYDSDAGRMPLTLSPEPSVAAYVEGRRIEVRGDATAALRRDLGMLPEAAGTLAPQGGSISTVYVFDAPLSTDQLLLRVSTSHPADQLTELFLIGDDDSLFHRKTYLAVYG